MAKQLVEYITKEGIRWDTIAAYAYGDSSRTKELIFANPTLPVSGTLPSGVYFYLPVLEKSETITEKESLPPWR